MVPKMDGTDGRTYTHNLIWGPHFRVLRHWSLRDQSSTERSVRFGSYSPFGPTPAASLRSAAGGFRSDTGGLASLVRRSGFVAIGFRFGRDVRDVSTHNQIWGPHSVPTSLIVRDQSSTATTSCERHQSKVTLWNIYIHTHMDTYIHTYIHT